MMFIYILVLLAVVVQITAKPYQTPMMGKEIGKRTLVVVDDMVCINENYFLY
jgi:hypothetical protein